MLTAEKFKHLRKKDTKKCATNNEWKLPSSNRKRCYSCVDTNRLKTPYQCSKCEKGICCDHSILLCKGCN